MKKLSTSDWLYLGLVTTLAIALVVFVFVPVEHVAPAQAAAVSWPVALVAAVLGFVGLRLARKTGFPDLWDARVSNTQRLLVPMLLGLGAGIVLILFDLVQPSGDIHVPFPASIPYYVYGGIVSENLFRLFSIPLFVWLVSTLLLRNRWQEQVFWGVAVVLSLLEPLGQLGAAYQMGALGQPLIALLLAAMIFGTNVTQSYLFRRSGFLAPLTMRLSLYLLWHIAYGGLCP